MRGTEEHRSDKASRVPACHVSCHISVHDRSGITTGGKLFFLVLVLGFFPALVRLLARHAELVTGLLRGFFRALCGMIRCPSRLTLSVFFALL